MLPLFHSRRFLTWFLLAALVAAACAPAEVRVEVTRIVEVEGTPQTIVVTTTPAALEPVKIEFWTDPMFTRPFSHPEFTQAGEYETWQAKRFMAMYPHVTISVQALAWEDLTTKTPAAVAAGTPPDIMKDYLGRTSGYAYQDVLVDLAGLVPEAELEDYVPSLLDQYRVNGILHALPAYYWESNIVVNKALFDQAGLTHMLPLDDYDWTFDEFFAAAMALKQAKIEGLTTIFGMSLGSEQGDYEYHQFIWGAGADLWKPDCSGLALDTPEALTGVEFINKLWVNGLINADALDPAATNYYYHMNDGKVAMFAGGLWGLGVVRDMDANGKSTVPVDPILLPFPHAEGTEKSGLVVGPTGFMVFKKDGRSQHELDWIIKFLQFLTSTEAQVDYAINSNQFPARRSAGSPVTDPWYRKVSQWINERGTENMGLTCPHFYEVRTIMPAHFQAMFLGQVTPAEAIKGIMQEANAITGRR